ncbi:MAG: hypothetical protein WBA74_17905, partial [Cyclobacteriaceae bacterium]
MKDTMIRCALLSVFSFFCLLGSVQAQDLHQTVRIADSLYNEGKLEEALQLYRRIAFFDKSEVYDETTFPRLASGFFQTGDYSNASRYFEYSYNISDDINYLYDQVLMQILAGDYKLAKLNLLNVSTGNNDEVKARKLALLSMV